jgi:hypothetical protein
MKKQFIKIERGLRGYFVCLGDEDGPIESYEMSYDTYEQAVPEAEERSSILRPFINLLDLKGHVDE